MDRVTVLEEKVRKLYKEKNPDRNDWADWLYENHIFLVASNALNLAKKYKANEELCYAAAILHDVGDTHTKRKNENHESETLRIATDLLSTSGFEPDEVKEIVDDALKFHSCIDGKKPTTITGKILATADAIAHINSNFYDYCVDALKTEMDDEEIEKWILNKLERDFNHKMLLEEEKNEMIVKYDRLVKRFEN